MQLFQQPPHRFHVLAVVGHVRVVHIHPIPHFIGKVVPDIGVTHHRFFTRLVVFCYGDFCAYVFFGDAQLFLHAQLYGESVCIPSRFAFYLLPFLGLVSAKQVFDGSSHNVVHARFTVGRGRTLKKYKRFSVFTLRNAFFKDVVGFMVVAHFVGHLSEVQPFVFRVFFHAFLLRSRSCEIK